MKTAINERNSAIVITICSIWVVFFLTDLPVWGYIENPVVLTDDQYYYSLGLHLALLEDPTGTLTIDDVTAPPYADRFVPGSEDVLNLGIGPVVYWIRIPMKNDTQHITDWRLRIENSYLDFIELYIPDSDTQGSPFTVKRSGDSIPFHEWDTTYQQFVFKISLPPHTEQTVYLRIENLDGITARMSVWSAEALAEQTAYEHIWYGVYFGSLGIMACYNLFIFFSLRDRSYLYYVLFVLSWILNEFSSLGFAYQYLWPNSPQLNESIGVLFGMLSGFFSLRFTAHFLKLATLHPVLNRVVTLLSAGWLAVLGATYLSDLGTTNIFIQLLTLGALITVIIAPIVSWRHGYRSARYLLVAWLTFGITGTTAVLTSLEMLPANVILLYSYRIGVVLLMLLLSWALADRINELKAQAEQKRLRTLELQQAKNLAEAANQAKSMFLANMSHELRTPLNAILGFAQVMARNPNIPPEEQGNLGIIQRNGEHLLTLINQVLNLSKIEAGRITLNEDTVNLHRLLHDVHDMFVFKANKKHLQLLFEQDKSVPRYVRTDQVKLREVLINLLSNAIKFTDEGGVTVRVKGLHPPTPLKGGISSDDDERKSPLEGGRGVFLSLLFEISDTGPGIKPEDMKKVFEAFGQTATGQQVQEGTGLGLSISRKFVQLMGGEIQVKSEVGCSTTFTFDIQCEVVNSIDNRQSSIVNRVVALEPGQPRYRMLIVDDNPDNRQLLFTLLNPFGFELREAENGQEAIEIWDTWEPHLIWMDIRMPVLDGYEATKRIRKLETRNSKLETRIIAVTASSFEEEQAVVLSAGCDDFLRKPFTDAEVFEMLRKHLGVRFIYEEETQIAGRRPQVVGEGVLTPEALVALPGEWLEALEQGAERADLLALSDVIEQIREQDARLADVLMRLAEDFEYDEILKFIQQTGKGEH